MGKLKLYIALILVILFAVIGASAYAFYKLGILDVFKEETEVEDESFGVKYKGVKLSSGAIVNFMGAESNVFEITGGKTYSVKVVPCEVANWTFTKDGEKCSFLSVSDLSPAFNFEYYSDYFIFSFDLGLTLQEVLERAYPGSEIVLSEEAMNSELNYALEIKSNKVNAKDKVETIHINFRCVIAGVVLDKNEITFLG